MMATPVHPDYTFIWFTCGPLQTWAQSIRVFDQQPVESTVELGGDVVAMCTVY